MGKVSKKIYEIEKFGIGIDIVSIKQFEKISYSKKPGFYKNFFLPSEIKYCLKYKNPHPHFAGKFAMKEAVIKSIKEKIPLINIETAYSRSKPIIKLRGKMNDKYKLIASISHENGLAISIVISERIR